ncbi:hypothetical protein [Blastococcus sp. DSM 46786]|nr:hypothetical protein [Blastococcus sp. DSM 46786]
MTAEQAVAVAVGDCREPVLRHDLGVPTLRIAQDDAADEFSAATRSRC